MIYIPTFIGNIKTSGDSPYGTEWYSRVLSNGGSATNNTIAAVNTFCQTLVAGGIYTKISRCNLFCGSNLSASFVPVIKALGNSIEQNHAFVDADYTPTKGLLGNGSTKYLNTVLDPYAGGLLVNSNHLSVYIQSGSLIVANGAQIGVDDGYPGIYFALNVRWSVDNYSIFYSGQNAASNMAGYPTTDTNTDGCYVGSRTASSSSILYRNGVVFAPTASVQSKPTLPNYPIYVFGQSDSANPIGYCSQLLGGYTVGSGLTATEVGVLTNAYTVFAATRN